MTGDHRIDRRVALAALATTAAAAVPNPSAAARITPPLQFFTPKAFAILDELAELIIPADAVSGGTRAANVANIIDARLAVSRNSQERQSWRDDIEELDRLCRELTGASFLKATPDQRTRLLDHISTNEQDPAKDGEYAFGTIKWTVADVYYRTRIGLHDDLKYQGNVALDEFLGVDVSKT